MGEMQETLSSMRLCWTLEPCHRTERRKRHNPMVRRLGLIWRQIALQVRVLSSHLGPTRIIALTQGIDIMSGASSDSTPVQPHARGAIQSARRRVSIRNDRGFWTSDMR